TGHRLAVRRRGAADQPRQDRQRRGSAAGALDGRGRERGDGVVRARGAARQDGVLRAVTRRTGGLAVRLTGSDSQAGDHREEARMPDTIRKVNYYYTTAPDKPGEGARLLQALRNAGVNLLAFHAFPSARKSQADFVPADAAASDAAATAPKTKLSKRNAEPWERPRARPSASGPNFSRTWSITREMVRSCSVSRGRTSSNKESCALASGVTSCETATPSRRAGTCRAARSLRSSSRATS